MLASMSSDLTPMLADWPFRPDETLARLIEGLDGEPRLQLRVELGILQLHVDGRPDGEEPYGHGSLLEHYEALSDEGEIAGPRAPGSSRESGAGGATRGERSERGERGEEEAGVPGPRREASFKLDGQACRLLAAEALQYRRRMLAFEALSEHARVVRDASRNLRVIQFVADHAQSDEDIAAFERTRPDLLRAKTIATARLMLATGEQRAAVVVIDDGLEIMAQWYAARGMGRQLDASPEVAALRAMRDSLSPRLPASQKAELRERLAAAIKAENYELAAILRDELKQITE
jgi:hypothetical protein